MNHPRTVLAPIAAAVLLVAAQAPVHGADYHHVHITASSPSEAVGWYARYLDCEPIADRPDAADCDGAELIFVVQPTLGSTQGTGVNHIGFSYPDLTAKMAELEAVGVRGSGVRLQRRGGRSVRQLTMATEHRFHVVFQLELALLQGRLFELFGVRPIELVREFIDSIVQLLVLVHEMTKFLVVRKQVLSQLVGASHSASWVRLVPAINVVWMVGNQGGLDEHAP